MSSKLIQDLENDGFSIFSEEDLDKRNPASDEPIEPTVVVVDTKEVLAAVAETSLTVKAGIENSNRQLQSSVSQIVNAIKTEQPSSFTLDIKRDERGFMSSVEVKINK